MAQRRRWADRSNRFSRPLAARLDLAILTLRGERVMVDTDLARLYGVAVGALNQAIKRNPERFPPDFMFQLTREEAEGLSLRSQSVILKRGRHRKFRPYVFTEQGVAMLSSVLRSPRAIAVNVEIMRAFVRLRRLAISHADLARRLNELEARYDAQFKVVFDAMRRLMEPPAVQAPKRRIGFRPAKTR